MTYYSSLTLLPVGGIVGVVLCMLNQTGFTDHHLNDSAAMQCPVLRAAYQQSDSRTAEWTLDEARGRDAGMSSMG